MRRTRTLRLLVALVAATMLLDGCDWATFRFGPAHTGTNPVESTIDSGNVANLSEQWSYAPTWPSSPPVVVGERVYETGGTRIVAFSSNGTTGCSGTPKVCSPLWIGQLPTPPPGPVAPQPGQITIAGGIAYVTFLDQLFAFDTTGSTGCASGSVPGDPVTCQPLWSAAARGIGDIPVVSDGFVFINVFFNRGDVYAYDARGQSGCSGSPKVCAPLWKAAIGAFTSPGLPAVANGLLYVPVRARGKVAVFDAAGQRGCSGTPVVCQPLWTAETGASVQVSTPAVTADGLYVIGGTTLYAFDPLGESGCSSAPVACTPRWRATGANTNLPPAIANRTLYLTSGTLRAYDARGVTNCGGNPTTCTPLWSSANTHIDVPPAAANGVVYAADNELMGCDEYGICTATARLLAFDAGGTANCTAGTCAPLWQYEETGSVRLNDPVIANGVLYAVEGAGAGPTVLAFTLP